MKIHSNNGHFTGMPCSKKSYVTHAVDANLKKITYMTPKLKDKLSALEIVALAKKHLKITAREANTFYDFEKYTQQITGKNLNKLSS